MIKITFRTPFPRSLFACTCSMPGMTVTGLLPISSERNVVSLSAQPVTPSAIFIPISNNLETISKTTWQERTHIQAVQMQKHLFPNRILQMAEVLYLSITIIFTATKMVECLLHAFKKCIFSLIRSPTQKEPIALCSRPWHNQCLTFLPLWHFCPLADSPPIDAGNSISIITRVTNFNMYML